MKIAILGSTGFVGRVLTEKALERGFKLKHLSEILINLELLKTKLSSFMEISLKLINSTNVCLVFKLSFPLFHQNEIPKILKNMPG